MQIPPSPPPPPPRQSQGPQKGFCFPCHSGRLISRSGAPPPPDGGSKAHMGMHSHMPASSFGDILPQGRKEVLGHPTFLFSRGHFWGSHSLVDTSLPPAIGPDKSWGPMLQLEEMFQEGQGKGNQGPPSALSRWPPDPPFPSPGEQAFRAPGHDRWQGLVHCRGSGFIAVGEERVNDGSGRSPASAHLHHPPQAHLLCFRSTHNPASGDREALRDEHTCTLAKPHFQNP